MSFDPTETLSDMKIGMSLTPEVMTDQTLLFEYSLNRQSGAERLRKASVHFDLEP